MTKTKDNKLIKTILINFICIFAICYLFTFILLYCNVNKEENRAVICNTEIGTDSVIAINNITKRLKIISQEEYRDCLLTTTSEGYGYEYNGELLRMLFNDGKVIQITFYNPNIDTIDIVINKDGFLFNKDALFLMENDKYSANYNGKNKFILKKK